MEAFKLLLGIIALCAQVLGLEVIGVFDFWDNVGCDDKAYIVWVNDAGPKDLDELAKKESMIEDNVVFKEVHVFWGYLTIISVAICACLWKWYRWMLIGLFLIMAFICSCGKSKK